MVKTSLMLAMTYIGDGQFVQTDFVGRPRTMGLKYSYKF